MEVSTTPLRWKFLKEKPKNRQERADRTNVAQIDFLPGNTFDKKMFQTASDLKDALATNPSKDSASPIHFRLYIVEDLSRSVIEALGAKFDIDPSFFREHIVDYAWYNLRDRFMDPPNLDIVTRQQDWFQVRWVRARYFKTKKSFDQARVEANRFNVLRRPDEDLNNQTMWDDHDATVALTRTRASFWRSKPGDEAVPTGELIP
jgi:hypothetical protein